MGDEQPWQGSRPIWQRPCQRVRSISHSQSVKRNIDRFPDDFRLQLTKDDYDGLRFQIDYLENSHFLKSFDVQIFGKNM